MVIAFHLLTFHLQFQRDIVFLTFTPKPLSSAPVHRYTAAVLHHGGTPPIYIQTDLVPHHVSGLSYVKITFQHGQWNYPGFKVQLLWILSVARFDPVSTIPVSKVCKCLWESF